MTVALLIIAAAILAVLYAVSLAVHPWVPCRSCKGGRVHGVIWGRAFGDCPGCGGSGRRPRLGVRVFQRARAAAIDSKRKKG